MRLAASTVCPVGDDEPTSVANDETCEFRVATKARYGAGTGAFAVVEVAAALVEADDDTPAAHARTVTTTTTSPVFMLTFSPGPRLSC
jgi:hypothetical protein